MHWQNMVAGSQRLRFLAGYAGRSKVPADWVLGCLPIHSICKHDSQKLVALRLAFQGVSYRTAVIQVKELKGWRRRGQEMISELRREWVN